MLCHHATSTTITFKENMNENNLFLIVKISIYIFTCGTFVLESELRERKQFKCGFDDWNIPTSTVSNSTTLEMKTNKYLRIRRRTTINFHHVNHIQSRVINNTITNDVQQLCARGDAHSHRYYLRRCRRARI